MRLTAVCKFLGSMRYRLVILWSLIMSEPVNIMWLIKRACSAHGFLSHLHSWETSSALFARICFSPVCLQLISFNRPSICCALYCLCVSVFSSSLRRTIYTTSHVVYTVLFMVFMHITPWMCLQPLLPWGAVKGHLLCISFTNTFRGCKCIKEKCKALMCNMCLFGLSEKSFCKEKARHSTFFNIHWTNTDF